MTNSLIPVKFHDDTIFYTEKDGEMFIPVKPLVENLGLSWGTQGPKLSENRVRFNCLDMKIVAADGKIRDMLCIPVRKLTAFLYSINANKVREDLRDKLIRYQEECDDVLYEYWMTGKVESKTFRNDKKDDLEMLEYFYTKCCGATGNQAVRALDRAMNKLHGYSPLAVGEVRLPDTSDDDLYYYKTVTEIGKMFGVSAVKLNTILTGLGLQTREQKYKKVKTEDGVVEKPDGFDYLPTELGETHGAKRVSDSASNNVQREVWALKWHKDKLPAYLRETYFKEETE